MKFKILVIAILFLFVQSVSAQETNTSKTTTDTNAKLSYKITNTMNNTFGYDIYNGEKMMIHQPSVPGLSGNEGFKTKVAAEKVAHLVISKIKKGEMPPSVSIDEMKKINAIP